MPHLQNSVPRSPNGERLRDTGSAAWAGQEKGAHGSFCNKQTIKIRVLKIEAYIFRKETNRLTKK